MLTYRVTVYFTYKQGRTVATARTAVVPAESASAAIEYVSAALRAKYAAFELRTDCSTSAVPTVFEWLD